MSSNNMIVIRKKGQKWIVSHNDLDCGEIEKIGKAETLEEAVEMANSFERDYIENGYGIEYGLRIIK